MSDPKLAPVTSRDWRIAQAVACAVTAANAGVPETVIADRLSHPTYGLTREQAELTADVAWILRGL